jgi:hypothetical protein
MPDRAGFLLAEDQALKAKFSGIQLIDDRDTTRDVQVFFRYPEGETEKKFPFITLEMLDIVHNTRRQHSDQNIYAFRGTAPAGQPSDHYGTDDSGSFKYWPNTTTDVRTLSSLAGNSAGSSPFVTTLEHVPVDLLYQVTTFTRSALHDRALQSHILTKVAPFRRGYLDIGIDGTQRHMDLMDWRSADMLDEEAGFKKRIFRKVYTLSITSEIPATALAGVGQVTTQAEIIFKDKIELDVLS